MTDRNGRTHVWAVARSPLDREAGLYILVGRSKSSLLAAANTRLYEDLAILAVALLLLLAGVWLLATMSVGRQVGRLAAMATKLIDAGHTLILIDPEETMPGFQDAQGRGMRRWTVEETARGLD